MIAISCSLAYLCLLASAFATKVYQLFLFQGCLLGLSQGIGMPLYFSLCSQWFLKRRGLATGIAVSGSGIGGGIETLLMRQLYISFFSGPVYLKNSHIFRIVKIGYRNTMLTFSSVHAVIWIFAWFLLKERLAPGLNPTAKKRWLPKKITGSFCSVALSMFFGVFGYLVISNLPIPYRKLMNCSVTSPLIILAQHSPDKWLLRLILTLFLSQCL